MGLRRTARCCAVAGVLFLLSAFSRGADIGLQASQVYDSLSLEERVGQLLDLRISVDSTNVAEYAELIRTHHIGSVTLEGGKLSDYIALAQTIHGPRKIPLSFSCRSAGGLGLALNSVPRLPTFNTLAAIKDGGLVEKLSEELSDEMDLLRIGAYGSTGISFRVQDRNIAMLRKVPAVAETFNDVLFYRRLLHSGKQVVFDLSISADMDRVHDPEDMNSVLRGAFAGEEKALIPGAFGAGALRSIILCVNDMPYFPADGADIFRRRFFNDLIHRYLGHQGLIKADMSAIRKSSRWRNDSSAVVGLLNAGCHIISSGDEIATLSRRIVRAVEAGRILQHDFRLKVESVLSSRISALDDTVKMAAPAALQRALFNPEMQILQKNVYKHTTKVEDPPPGFLPVQPAGGQYTATLSIGGSSSPGFRRMVDRYVLATHFFLPYYAYDPFKVERLKEQLARYDRIIVALYSDPFLVMDERLHGFLDGLGNSGKAVLVSMGTTGRLQGTESFDVRIAAPEANVWTESLIAQVMFGGMDYPFTPSALPDGSITAAYTNGSTKYNLGFALPEEHEMDSRTLSGIDRIVEEAIDIGATPGCQILVVRNGDVVFDKNYGYYTYDSIRPVTSNTLYDLASITKVAATTQLVMMLYERGLVDLDTKLSDYLPELAGTNKEDIVIRAVLTHQAGLRPFYPFWIYTMDDDDSLYYSNRPDTRYSLEVADGMYGNISLRDSIWHWTMQTRMLRKRRGVFEYKYSDLGFYLLERLLNRILDTTIDIAADSMLFNPMGLGRVTYRPMCRFPREDIAPTENDRQFRPGQVWGTVHDQIAAMSGGIGGHAGLFGNATDLAKIMMMNLQGGTFAGKQYISEETLDLFTSVQVRDNRRGLGWDKPENHEVLNPVSRYASMSSYGHRGFTGTIVWADPTFNLIFVFLSNRVYPNARNTKLIDFNVRKRIQDLVYESIWDFEKYHYR